MTLPTAHWNFPLPRPHTGLLLGNATMGLMIYGQDNLLKITIGRADLWDHRGGLSWTAKQNYADIQKHLQANDEEALLALFTADTQNQKGQPRRPSIIPVGRMDLQLADDVILQTGSLNLATGIATLTYLQAGAQGSLTVFQSMDEQLAIIQFNHPDLLKHCINQPAYITTGDAMKNISFVPPTLIKTSEMGGYIQPLPQDPGVAVGYQRHGNELYLVTTRNQSVDQMLTATQAALSNAIDEGRSKQVQANQNWWNSYWKDVPKLDLPNAKLQFLYDYGMYKFACTSQPDGIACTLQGPWIEDDRLPPWSSDYHFNINVQMCYWPAMKGNRLAHLKPLFEMIFSWEEKLKENAKLFAGIDNGVMLPHAVDDRCVCMGGFWTGNIDHACTAWVAMMMFDYVRYTNDLAYLKDKVYPFMANTMHVFEAMLEKEGERYTLPVSISPEYRGAAMDAWGSDASFQLAAIHRLLENLQSAAALLDVEPQPQWADVQEHLPQVTQYNLDGKPIIALWEGTYLEESHRHHAHLGAISPFDTIDINSPQWQTLVNNSITQWVKMGMGQWTGWCVPWASMIHSRLHNGKAAELLLEIWQSVFTNQGHGTLHDCNFPGISIFGVKENPSDPPRPETMQLDAGFGAVTAITEMLLHTQREVLHVMAGVPQDWKQCSFSPMPTEFGVSVSASRAQYQLQQITLQAARDTTFKIANPWDDDVTLTTAPDKTHRLTGKVLTLSMKQDEIQTLIKCPSTMG